MGFEVFTKDRRSKLIKAVSDLDRSLDLIDRMESFGHKGWGVAKILAEESVEGAKEFLYIPEINEKVNSVKSFYKID